MDWYLNLRRTIRTERIRQDGRAWSGTLVGSLKIDDVDGQIPVVCGELPTAVLFAPKFGLVGKELFGDLAFGLPWRRVGGGANDDDTVIPAVFLTGVKANRVVSFIERSPDAWLVTLQIEA